MPTAGKLAGAIFFAALAYMLSLMAFRQSGLSQVPDMFFVICSLIGAGCGWRVMGSRAAAPARDAPSSGVLTVVFTVVLALLFFATREMLIRSMNHIYRGPIEGLIGVFDIAGDYLMLLATPAFGATMVVGGIACGVLSGVIGRRWP